MQIKIFTFSGTGNTWWLVNEFKNIAINYGYDVDVSSIEQSSEITENKILKSINDSDILGFAYPIYGSDWPRFMRDFIFRFVEIFDQNRESIQREELPPVLVLTTMMMFSGDGALMPKKYFKKRGFPFKWGVNFALSSNLSVPMFRANPYEEEKLNENKQKAKKKLKKLLNRIKENKDWREHQWNLIFRIVALLQRVSEPLLFRIMHFGVDSKRCIQCMQCVDHCPTKAIHFDEETETFKFSDNCTFCMRCYNLCPKYAITVNEKVCLPPKYERIEPIMDGFKFSDLHD
ncbi:MAG: 4Fe-4S dicluster domain-containing protein [Candidatus Lokiarchaeota archaeon]|nr:4Fe-4S dicluster domain-containing protein [Candidatus Lokiarchaeota archaeon]